jgi:hypothetical protein
MSSDERLTTKSNEGLATADLGQTTEQTRRHHEEDGRQEGIVFNKDAAALSERATASSGAAAVRQEPTITKDTPAHPHAEPQTRTSVFEEREAQPLRSRWTEIQGGFVDDPRRAVKEADALVAEVVKRLAEIFANERNDLERQWDRGDDVTTEDLRVALRRYHAFFDRLLAV